MFTTTHDNEEIIERVAALDIGNAELMCCVRSLLSGDATNSCVGSAQTQPVRPVGG
jgi:hypothetical protein